MGEVILEVRLPRPTRSTMGGIGAQLDEAVRFTPFDEPLVEYCAAFASRLSRRARGFGELQALAFWMRRAELVRMAGQYRALEGARTVLMPRGVVFHIPPANVDTIFIYSWLLSLLCGNRNVVRLSSRSTPQTELLLEIASELAADDTFSAVAASTVMVRYPHDDAVTAGLSALADLRVIWGGDASVRAIRRAPLAPHATDLTFPDRESLAALDAAAVDALTPADLTDLAARFYNDAYWFDQLGCSSPRSVLWVGEPAVARRASGRFFAALKDVTIEKGLRVETGAALAKLTYGFGAAIDRDVDRVTALGNEILVIEESALADVPAGFVGAGTFHSVVLADLSELAGHIGRRHQTLSHFGFRRDDLRAFIGTLRGRGLDRLVPIGEALTFNRFWDGNDLFSAFSRWVYLDGGLD